MTKQSGSVQVHASYPMVKLVRLRWLLVYSGKSSISRLSRSNHHIKGETWWKLTKAAHTRGAPANAPSESYPQQHMWHCITRQNRWPWQMMRQNEQNQQDRLNRLELAELTPVCRMEMRDGRVFWCLINRGIWHKLNWQQLSQYSTEQLPTF